VGRIKYLATDSLTLVHQCFYFFFSKTGNIYHLFHRGRGQSIDIVYPNIDRVYVNIGTLYLNIAIVYPNIDRVYLNIDGLSFNKKKGLS